MLTPMLEKNDRKAKWLIGVFSVVVFSVVTVLGKYNLAGKVQLDFDVHIFATINAAVNGLVALLLLVGLYLAKQRNTQAGDDYSNAVICVLFTFLYLSPSFCWRNNVRRNRRNSRS